MVLSDAAKNAMLQGLADTLNVGANSVLSVYIGEVLAVELVLPNPAQMSIAGGVMTFNKPPDALAIASGVPTSAKLLDGTGAVIANYLGAEIVLNKDKVYQGGYVGIESLKVRI